MRHHDAIFLANTIRAIEQRLARIEAKLDVLTKEIPQIMSALDDLTTQVKANTDAEASAVQLIQGLATQIAAAATDPAKVQALASQLKSSATALAAAVLANTDAAPSPPATP